MSGCVAAAQLLQDSCTNDKSHQGAGLPPPLAGPAFSLAVLGFLSRAPWRRCGKARRLPSALVLACLMEESGFQNCKFGFFQNRLIHSGKQTPLRPPPFLPNFKRRAILGTQRQPFTRGIKKDLGWLCQAQLPLKPKERLQEHGCLSVPFRE